MGMALMPATMATMVEGRRGAKVPLGSARQRVAVRPLAVWQFPGRPARSALVSALDNDQLQRGLTQEVYAEGFGVSRRTYLRFRAGGKLSKQLRHGLYVHRPKWKRLVDKVVLEDVRFDDLLGGLG
jgi:hypothetical protein